MVAPHPLNDGFTWTDHAGPYRVLRDDQVAAYDEHGFFVLEDALDPSTVAAVRTEIDHDTGRARHGAFQRLQVAFDQGQAEDLRSLPLSGVNPDQHYVTVARLPWDSEASQGWRGPVPGESSGNRERDRACHNARMRARAAATS